MFNRDRVLFGIFLVCVLFIGTMFALCAVSV
jgi:hypothetical protein